MYFVSTHDEDRPTPILIDFQREDGLSAVLGQSLEQMRRRWPNIVLMSADDFRVLQERAFTTEPVEITEDKFIEMSEVLPPANWRYGGGGESFMLSEFTTGYITGIYCRLGKRYFSFQGVCTLSHAEIMEKCKVVAGG